MNSKTTTTTSSAVLAGPPAATTLAHCARVLVVHVSIKLLYTVRVLCCTACTIVPGTSKKESKQRESIHRAYEYRSLSRLSEPRPSERGVAPTALQTSSYHGTRVACPGVATLRERVI